MKNKIFQKFLDLIFVKDIKCIYCNKELNKPHKYCLCENCYSKLKFNNQKVCSDCGIAIFGFADKCPKCLVNKNNFQKAYSIFVYEGIIKDLVKKFKFSQAKYLGEYLGLFLYEKYIELGLNCDIIIPVPVHKKTLKIRGYNQAEVLCWYLKNDFCVRTDILYKEKITNEQAKLNFKDRTTNLKNTFIIKNQEVIKNKTILLIDDVLTTGSTANECSKILREFGAKKVYVLTLCSTAYNLIEKINY